MTEKKLTPEEVEKQVMQALKDADELTKDVVAKELAGEKISQGLMEFRMR